MAPADLDATSVADRTTKSDIRLHHFAPLVGRNLWEEEMSIVAVDRTLAVADRRRARFDELFRKEYPTMMRLAYALVGNGSDAEDLVQDSFVEVFRRLDEIDRPGAYLRTSVVNHCRSALRRRRMMAEHPPDPPEDLTADAGEFWDVLAKLPDEQRIAIVLKYYGRFRASEIARMFDEPASTVRSHIRRGLATLRKELEREQDRATHTARPA